MEVDEAYPMTDYRSDNGLYNIVFVKGKTRTKSGE